MAGKATDGGAFEDAVVFPRHFNDMPDPHRRGKVDSRLTPPPQGGVPSSWHRGKAPYVDAG